MTEYLNNPQIAGCQITPWPNITCVCEIDRPRFCTLDQLPGVQLFLNMLEAAEQVPHEIMKAVREYRCCQLPLLALAGLFPERFLVLHEQSPALTLSLAVSLWLNPRCFPAVNSTQRCIWRTLGADGSASFSRTMAKIPAALSDPDALAVLGTRWANSSIFRRLFRHVPKVTKSVLDCFQSLKDDELLPSFINIAAECTGFGRGTFAHIQMLVHYHHLIAPGSHLPYQNLRTSEAVQHAVARLMERLACEEYSAYHDPIEQYPEEVPGTASILRVKTNHHLRDVAERTQNCIFNYHNRIKAGLAAAYVVEDRHLTILLEKQQGRWRLTAMERPYGMTPTAADWNFIQTWRKENNL